MSDARIFIGDWQNGAMNEGTLFQLKNDNNSYSVYNVRYDYEADSSCDSEEERPVDK